MKTFDERIKRIQKKAKRMKTIRFGISSSVVTLCIAAVVFCGLRFGPGVVTGVKDLFVSIGGVLSQISLPINPTDSHDVLPTGDRVYGYNIQSTIVKANDICDCLIEPQVFQSVKELSDFCDLHVSTDGNKAVFAQAQKYDDVFFQNNSLIVLVKDSRDRIELEITQVTTVEHYAEIWVTNHIPSKGEDYGDSCRYFAFIEVENQVFPDNMKAAAYYIDSIIIDLDPTPTTVPKAYENQEVTIQLAHAMSTMSEELLQTYITEFNKIYPNIHINTVNYGSADGLKGSLTTFHSNTDLVLCLEDNAVQLQQQLNNVVNLESLIRSNQIVTRGDYSTEILGLTAAQKDAFYALCLDSCRLTEEAEIYSLPFYQLPEVMYYNKTYFEANDLQVPQSWDEVWETAVRIQAKGDPVTPLSVVYPHKLFATLMQQNHVPVQNQFGSFNYDDVAVERFVVEFARQYGAGNWSDTSGYSLTRNAMILDRCVGGNQFASSDGSYEVGVAPVPQVNGSNPRTWTQNASFCILDHNDAQKVIASWLFMKFLTTDPEIQADFSMKTGFLPVNKEAVALPEYQQWLASADGYDNVTALAVKCALEQLDSYFSVQNIPRAYSSLKNVTQAFCMTSNVTDETVLAYYRQLYRDYVRTEPEKPSPIIPEMFVGTGEGFSCKPQYFIASWKDPYGEVYQVKDHPMQKDMQSLFDPNSDYQIVSVTTDYLAVGMGWTTEPTEVEITCWDIQYHGLTNYAEYAESPEWTGDQLKLAPGTYLYVVKCYWENDGQVDAYGKVEYAFIATCSPAGEESDGLRFVKLEDDTYGVMAGEDFRLSEVIIPSIYKGVPVTYILPNGFRDAATLESIYIPESVTSIGDGAFYHCLELEEITFNEGITSIGDNAFYLCHSLQSVSLPDSITELGVSVFNQCRGLKTIKLPSNLTMINAGMFQFCSKLTEITIPNMVQAIGDSAFQYSGLVSITLPDSVTYISPKAFYFCTALTDINMSKKMKKIDEYAFLGCCNLEKIHYGGTMDQWEIVFKGLQWSDYAGEYTVDCTDGEIKKTN